MGLALAALISSFVDDLIMPIIAMIFGEPDFSGLTFTINDAVFRYGAFLTALITFITTAAAIFFFVVRPMNALMARMRKLDEDEVTDAERRHQELLAALRSRAQRVDFRRIRRVREGAAEALVQEDEADLVDPRLERAHGGHRKGAAASAG